MFTSITPFESLDAVRAFASDDYERTVVEDVAHAALSRWAGGSATTRLFPS